MISWEKNYKLLKRYNKYPFDFVIKYSLKYFNPNQKTKVLDLGCGGGGNTKFLIDAGFNTYGVDVSPTAINLTRKKLSISNKKKIIRSDFKKLPFKNNFFDLIVDRNSLTHNNEEDLEIIIPEINRVLKKGGKVISSFFSLNHSHRSFGKKIKGFKNSYSNFKKGDFKHSPIVYFADKKNLKFIFGKFKFLNLIKVNNKNLLRSNYNKEYFVMVIEK